jgi:hypothetical protein
VPQEADAGQAKERRGRWETTVAASIAVRRAAGLASCLLCGSVSDLLEGRGITVKSVWSTEKTIWSGVRLSVSQTTIVRTLPYVHACGGGGGGRNDDACGVVLCCAW